MSRLAKELALIAVMAPSELGAAWAAAGAGAMPSLPVGLQRRLLAQHIQEQRIGRLPAVVARELDRIAAGEKPGAVSPRPPVLSPGTRLIREWNGRTISVEVLGDGFQWEGRQYRSLSEIARVVTGAHWSGPRFFGLRRHG